MGEVVVAKALLWLPDGRAVFQRRPRPNARGIRWLGFFGGKQEEKDLVPRHAKPSFLARVTLRRELAEETTIPPADIAEMPLRPIGVYNFGDEHEEPMVYHLFEGQVADSVQAQPGQGDAEVHTLANALEADPSPSARFVLKHLIQAKGRVWA